MTFASVLMYMHKLVGFDVGRIGAKGAGVYISIKIFLKGKVYT
jgi:hypothetical protein